ncbi:MAG: hypothetical protein ABJF11_14195 [Reichenbachiella sp.]|uniref:hypothetical protein n=1 Tax=Reichenbachiella sp. TaxID=2184521 RepID=UPI0032637F6E
MNIPTQKQSINQWLRIASILLVLLSLIEVSIAQNEVVVEIDATTKIVKKKPPFDQPFVIKIIRPSKEKSIEKVFLYESFVRNGEKTPLDRKGELGRKLPVSGFEEKDDALYIYVEPIKPNVYLELIIRHKITGEGLGKLLSINGALASGNAAEIAKAETSFDELASGLDDVSTYADFPISAFGANGWTDGNFWQDYKTFYRGKLKPFYDATMAYNFNITGANLTSIKLTALAIGAKNSGMTSKELNQFSALVRDGKVADLLKGTQPFDPSSNATKIDDFDFAARTKTLGQTIMELQQIIVFCEGYYLISNNAIRAANKPIIDDLNALLSKLKTNAAFLQKNQIAIVTAIQKEKNLRYAEAFILDNQFADLKTASGFRVVPDFGIANIWVNGNESNEVYQRFYFGVNITPRPVNKQIKFREYKDSNLWRRWSFSLGVTSSSLPEGEFEDLYKSSSLLAGINFRVLRGLYISSGTVVLRRKDPNPIITDTNVIMAPFVGISLDVDINNAISSITGKFL